MQVPKNRIMVKPSEILKENKYREHCFFVLNFIQYPIKFVLNSKQPYTNTTFHIKVLSLTSKKNILLMFFFT